MSNLSFEFTKELNHYQLDYQLYQLIEAAEDQLRQLPVSGFHKIIGRDLLHLTSKIKGYLANYYDLANQFYRMTINSGSVLKLLAGKIQPDHIKSIHCEMNTFAKSTELWFIDLFSYSSNLKTDTVDWINNFDYFTLDSLTITGYEDIQEVYRKYNLYNIRYTTQNLEISCSLCEILIILRLQEVLINAIESSKTISKIPFYLTFYNSDMVLKINNKNMNSHLILNQNCRGGNHKQERYSYFGESQLQA